METPLERARSRLQGQAKDWRTPADTQTWYVLTAILDHLEEQASSNGASPSLDTPGPSTMLCPSCAAKVGAILSRIIPPGVSD